MLSRKQKQGSRAVSPVVAVALLLALTVIMVAVVAPAIMGAVSDQQQVSETDIQLSFHYVGGASDSTTDDFGNTGNGLSADGLVTIRVETVVTDIDAGEVAVDSDTSGGNLADDTSLYSDGDDLSTSDTMTVWIDSTDTVSIIWTGSDNNYSELLATYALPLSIAEAAADGPATVPDGVVFTGTNNGILRISGDGGSTSVISTSAKPKALGPASDIDEDGTIEVPYVDDNGDLRLVDENGDETLLADSTDIPDAVREEQTRLAVDTWNGSDPSVFFVDDTQQNIYRTAPDSSVENVANTGAGGAIGSYDIDGDGSDEFIYLGSSYDIRYMESDGSTGVVYSNAGDSNGVGGGSVADYDNDGTDEVAIVDGGNNIVLADASSDETIDGGYTDSGVTPQATESPATGADVDDDGTPELMYVDKDSENVYYLDDIEQGPGNVDIKTLTDEDGNTIDADDYTGLT